VDAALVLSALVLALAALAIIGIVLWDAFETVLVPRRIGRRIRLTRYYYLLSWRTWRSLALTVNVPSRREAVLGVYGPISLIGLLAIWAAGLVVAFAMLQLALTLGAGRAPDALWRILYMSGETFVTLGFGDVTPGTAPGKFVAVIEAGMGFGFFGTVIGYLPTIYSGFSAREIEISLMDARAGSPPTAAEFLRRIALDGDRALVVETLHAWERWAAQLLETHISYPLLAYYRSQHVNQSWLAALTTILDSTAFLLARDGEEGQRPALLTFAMARHALVDVTQLFVRDMPPRSPDRLAGIERERLVARLAEGGVRMPDDERFERRLAELRLLYEPYAQALATALLYELPPWALAARRRDNWKGGPWDRQLSAGHGPATAIDDHF
jgi:hypothetical protein